MPAQIDTQIEEQNDARIDEVLQFWFGKAPDDAQAIAAIAPRWWTRDDTFDAEIRTRFAAQREAAIRGALDGWLHTPRGRLALIVLVDQFSRNLFRGLPAAFAHDALARRWCLDGIARGDDRALLPIERQFYYLPLEHSESAADQQHSLRLYAALRDEAPLPWRTAMQAALDFAVQHQRIIERFGRFPHRNAVLGRDSTEEEREFLRQPGSSF